MKRLGGLALGAVFLSGLGFAGLDRMLPPDLSRTRAQSLMLLDRDGNLLDGHTAPDGAWRLQVMRTAVDPDYVALLLSTEDRRFWLHPGIDPLAMLRAIGQMALRGHVVSGGSTIAMQAARLLSPHPHDAGGKLSDMLRALQLEWRYGRAGVLEIYLMLAPEGGNIEGIRAASRLYFGHDPQHLSPREAALLVALPRRPAFLRPDRVPARSVQAAARVLRRAGQKLPPDMAAPRRIRMPHDAPHLRDTLWVQASRGIVRTTLDGDLQRAVSRMARSTQVPAGGEFAALVVRGDLSVAAWLGGSAVPSAGAGAAVDMIRARRSPGSTLKPFIYGLAFGDGSLRPETLIEDRRMRLGRYAPHDFDRSFHGIVSAAEALRQSYNLPAVQVLELVGASRFDAALRDVGIHPVLPGEAGATLALALGGVGMSLQDLAGLYAGLAHDGRVGPLQVIAGTRPGAPTMLLTRKAARDVVGILRGVALPDGLPAWSRRPIGFKTGTSYGGRDAWAAGISPGWTVVVWAGRPEGTAVPGMTGRDNAAPLMARVFDLLPLETGAFATDEAVIDLPHLSPALRRLGAARPVAPQIIYPPPGSVVESRRDDGSMAPIGLEAAGGLPPYRWMIEGQPLAALPGGEANWMPDGIGFAHVSVTDSADRSASVEIRVR